MSGDIGKNIASSRLFWRIIGYQVFDLGKDVPVTVVETAIKEQASDWAGGTR